MNMQLQTLNLTRYDEKYEKLKTELENGASSGRFINQIAQRLYSSIYSKENIFQSAFVVLDGDVPLGYLYISSNRNDEVFLDILF